MSNSNTTREVSYFTRFLWFVAGADIEMLSLCPLDYKKYEAIGMTILMTSLVGFAAGSSAAWYFTEDALWTLVFGLFWSLLIFSIDRSLVVTLKRILTRSLIMSCLLFLEVFWLFWLPVLCQSHWSCLFSMVSSKTTSRTINRICLNSNIG